MIDLKETYYNKRKRGNSMSRKYSEEFKKQMVTLYNSGKPPGEIISEYELSPSSLYKWISRYNNSGSFE